MDIRISSLDAHLPRNAQVGFVSSITFHGFLICHARKRRLEIVFAKLVVTVLFPLRLVSVDAASFCHSTYQIQHGYGDVIVEAPFRAERNRYVFDQTLDQSHDIFPRGEGQL